MLVIGCTTKQDAGSPADNVAGQSAGTGLGDSGASGTSAGTGVPLAGSSGTSAGTGQSGNGAGMGQSGTGAGMGQSGTGAGADAGADDASMGDGGEGPLRGTGPGDWGPGDYPPNLMAPEFLDISGVTGQKGNVRQYKVHVPPSYDPATPTPLVFCIHGLGQDALLCCLTGTAMHTKSDQAGFILVMPNGFQNSWNAGTCCGGASTEQLDDVALFRAIFEEVSTHVNIDLDRVYATGLSNGGYMSYRLACEASDIFAAVAPVAGAIGINDIGGGTNPGSNFTSCAPEHPVSILHTHGTMDPLIPFRLQAPSQMLAASNNGCESTTQPATVPTGGGDTTCITYEGCPAGIELSACTIEGGGHCWFGSPDCGTGGGAIDTAIVGNNSDTMKNTEAGWAFFERLSK
jgi:polyhydroxybutyrate depolymerase